MRCARSDIPRVAGIARRSPGEVVDLIEGDGKLVLAVLAHAHDAFWPLAPPAVSATATARAMDVTAVSIGSRRSRSCKRRVAKSAIPKGLVRVACLARPPCPMVAESLGADVATSRPIPGLLVEHAHQVGIEVGLHHLFGEAASSRRRWPRPWSREVDGAAAQGEAGPTRRTVVAWISNVCSVPLLQPSCVLLSISGGSRTTSGDGRCASAARASSMPLGVPSPLARS